MDYEIKNHFILREISFSNYTPRNKNLKINPLKNCVKIEKNGKLVFVCLFQEKKYVIGVLNNSRS